MVFSLMAKPTSFSSFNKFLYFIARYMYTLARWNTVESVKSNLCDLQLVNLLLADLLTLFNYVLNDDRSKSSMGSSSDVPKIRGPREILELFSKPARIRRFVFFLVLLGAIGVFLSRNSLYFLDDCSSTINASKTKKINKTPYLNLTLKILVFTKKTTLLTITCQCIVVTVLW